MRISYLSIIIGHLYILGLYFQNNKISQLLMLFMGLFFFLIGVLAMTSDFKYDGLIRKCNQDIDKLKFESYMERLDEINITLQQIKASISKQKGNRSL